MRAPTGCSNTEPDAGLNGRTLRYPRGKTLGGSSSINGMIYMRGQSRDYDGWAQRTGDAAGRWDNCLPAFKKHEDFYKGADPLHGVGGEWRVEKQRLRWDVLDAFAKAAQEAGIPHSEDFNRGNNEGVGYFQVNQKNGWRWNTAKAFLRPTCYGRPNFELWTGAQCQAPASRPCPMAAAAAPAPRSGRRPRWCTRRRQREVLLCAGSIGSPQLLQLSGIGPADLLRSHGIPVVLDLPGVGENLQDHLQIRAVYKVDGVATLNTLANSWWGKLKIGAGIRPEAQRPHEHGAVAAGRLHAQLAGPLWPNIEYHVQPLSLDAFGEPLHASTPSPPASATSTPPAAAGCASAATSSTDAPAIAPNYLSTPEDRKVAADSLRVTRRIAAQPALAKFKPQEWKPGPQYQSDEDLARLAGDIATTIFHPVGTTKMGADDDPMAVLDSKLRVRGVAGLRVVDAGACPPSPAATPIRRR
jgi:choline dehydrogenase